MKAKIIMLGIIIVLYAGTAFASDATGEGNPLHLDDLLLDPILAIQSTQIILTEHPEERLQILQAASTEVMSLIDGAGDLEALQLLTAHLERQEQMIWATWDDLDDEEAGEVLGLMIELNESRSGQLEKLLSDGKIPPQAQQGLNRALENQQRAMEKKEESFKKAEEAHVAAQEKAARAADAALSSAPGQSGATPGQSGSTPGQSGSAPGQSGSTPGGNSRPDKP